MDGKNIQFSNKSLAYLPENPVIIDQVIMYRIRARVI